MTVLIFGEWLPDLPDFRNSGALKAANVFPTPVGYRPVKDLSVITNALSGRPFGGITARDSSNNVYIYAGTATTIEEAVSNTFTDESKAGGYSTAADDVWEFTEFGDKIIATNFTDAVQSIDIGGGSAGAFADHITSTDTPKAKHLAVVRDFLVLGNVNDEAGHTPNRIRWSGINDSADFDEDQATQSDKQDLPEGGWVQKVVGNVEYGLVFQEKLIRRMDYIGPPLVFDIQPIAKGTGTPIPNSVISHDRQTFFISGEGFSRVIDGSVVQRIGSERVDRTFWDQFSISNKRGVVTAIDERNKIVMWAFPGSMATLDIPNKIYFYNWEIDRWSEADLEVEFLLDGATQGMNVDTGTITDIDLDPTFASVSIDSDVFKGGEIRVGAFKTDHKLYNFIGDNLAATIDTAEDQPIEGRRSKTLSARPLVDGGTPTLTPITRNRLIDSVSTGSAVTINAFGECPLRTDARYQRFRMIVPAASTWTHAQGVEITRLAPGGIR